MAEQLARHTLVWLSAQADWRADVAAQDPRLATWFAQGWPAVVARRAADDPDVRVRLGVPLPPCEGKQRLGLRVPVQHLARRQPPLPLAPLLDTPAARIPADWRTPLQALSALAPARVYGAFAWQALTGMDYVHARSDIDLLWSVHSAAQADALAARLLAWEAQFDRRVDGELCLASGSAVNWREYAGRARQVLVKRIDGALLEARENLFALPGAVA